MNQCEMPGCHNLATHEWHELGSDGKSWPSSWKEGHWAKRCLHHAEMLDPMRTVCRLIKWQSPKEKKGK